MYLYSTIHQRTLTSIQTRGVGRGMMGCQNTPELGAKSSFFTPRNIKHALHNTQNDWLRR